MPSIYDLANQVSTGDDFELRALGALFGVDDDRTLANGPIEVCVETLHAPCGCLLAVTIDDELVYFDDVSYRLHLLAFGELA